MFKWFWTLFSLGAPDLEEDEDTDSSTCTVVEQSSINKEI